MSGCAHMNPEEWCASCIGNKYTALREENARLRERISDLENACMVHHDEVARLEGLILDWDSMDMNGAGEEAVALEVEARRIRAAKGKYPPPPGYGFAR